MRNISDRQFVTDNKNCECIIIWWSDLMKIILKWLSFYFCSKASAADLVAQSGEKRGLNGRRNLAFILYGGAYQGVFQEHMYNHIFPILFGYGTSTLTVASKVLFDILFLNPMLCLPCAYLSKGAIFGYSPKEAIRRYINDIRQHGLLIKSWCIWLPVQCITFSIIPEYLRISFIAAVSFFWLIILSSVSARREKLVKTWFD